MTMYRSSLLLVLAACGCGGRGATGLCATDNDCVFRPNSGCCGACLAQDDPVPPPLPCGAACTAFLPSCLCQNGHCQTGTLRQGASCSLQRDECGGGLKCCATSADPQPQCVMPLYPQGTPVCPPIR